MATSNNNDPNLQKPPAEQVKAGQAGQTDEQRAAASVSPGPHGPSGTGHPTGAEGVRQANQPGPTSGVPAPDPKADQQQAKDAQQQQRQATDSALDAARRQGQQQGVQLVGSSAGGPFNITGSGFGDKQGSVTVGGQPVNSITRWDDSNIRGNLSAGMKGEVVVRTADGKVQKGQFGQ